MLSDSIPGLAETAATHGGSQPHLPTEAIDVAAALARKVGCRRLTFIGCPHRELLSAVPADLAVVEADVAADLTDILAMVGADLVLRTDFARAELPGLLVRVPAAVVFDPSGGVGLEAFARLILGLEDAGVRVAHRTVVRAPGMAARESPLIVVTGSAGSETERLLLAGARGLSLDPEVDLDADLGRPLRICVASYEVAGPTRNGGIGTANTSLAHALGRAGHDVTLLFTGNAEEGPQSAERWRMQHQRDGVRFEVLGEPLAPGIQSPHYNVRRAYELYQRLLESDRHTPFDVVHFPECQGHGYYAVLAKHLGLAFEDTLFVAGVHSSTRWCAEANRELPLSIDALVDEHLERRSVELADVLVSPSAYMIDYMLERGWQLPRRRFVQQYVLPPPSRRRSGVPARTPASAPDELIFFGRLEIRKGIETFCDAVDLLAAADGGARTLKISFLGRPEHVGGELAVDYVARRSRHWPWRCELIGERDRSEAMSYLRHANGIAVMPSTIDNSPNTVSEALGLGVALVTSRSGGTGELIDPLDLARCTFAGVEATARLPPAPADDPPGELSAVELADRLRSALDDPAPAPVFAIDHEANECVHVAWHVGAAATARNETDQRFLAPPEPLPSLSIGVLHCGDPANLGITVNALAEQADEMYDVVVVTDGSEFESADALDEARRVIDDHGWTFIRRTRSHAAEAYELIEAQTDGELLGLMRSGTRPRPGAINRIRAVAARSGAALVSWATVDRVAGPPAVSVPVDGPPLIGLLYPAFACGGFAIARSTLRELGGFCPDAASDDADQDLLNRAQLGGHHVVVVPEPLTETHTGDDWSVLRTGLSIESAVPSDSRDHRLRIARAFRHATAQQLADLPGLFLALSRKTGEGHRPAEYVAYLEGEHHRLSAEVHRLQASEAVAPHRRLRRLAGRLKRRAIASSRR